MTWRKRMQQRLGVGADGVFGRLTYAALFAKLGAAPQRAAELALGANVHFPAYNIDTPLRLVHFMAQVAHESGGFRWMEEIASGQAYEGRKDLGNVIEGDGKRFKGRGPLQLTGRANYREYGRRVGIDFESSPFLVAIPSVGLLVACEYWQQRSINTLADRDDLNAVTKAVNGGLNGLADRRQRLEVMRGLVS